MAAYRRVSDSRHVTCRLAAKNRDQRIRVDLDIAVSAQPVPNAAYHSSVAVTYTDRSSSLCSSRRRAFSVS